MAALDGAISPLFPPAALTAFAARILEDLDINRLIGAQLFPNQLVPSEHWTTGLQSSRDYTEEAEFRAWDVPPSIGSRPGLYEITGNIVPIGRMLPLSEENVRLLKFAREKQVPDAVRTQVYNDAARLVRMVDRRLERARWEALDWARVSIGAPGATPSTELGQEMRVDFLRNANRRFSVTTKWDQALSTPLQDELDYLEEFSDEGVEFGVALMSRLAYQVLSTHSDYTEAFDSIRARPRLTLPQVNEVRAEFSLPQIVLHDAKTKQRPPGGPEALARLQDQKRIIYVPAGQQMGTTMYGLSSYVGEEGVQGAGARGGPIIFVMKTMVPLRYYTVIDAVAFPVLFNPDDTASVEVLT